MAKKAGKPEAAADSIKTPETVAADSAYKIGDPSEFAKNLVRVGQQSQKLLTDFAKRQSAKAGTKEPLDPLNITGAFTELLKAMTANPAAIVDAQLQLWRDWMGLWDRTARKMLGDETVEPLVAPAPGDKRFKDKDWQENQVFDFIKQSYLLTANWMQNTVANVEGMEVADKKRIAFYTKQFADAMAPTNFVLTNPEVLRTTLQSNGENLIKGLDNLLEDMGSDGQLSIRQSADAFVIGQNIATAPGKVVFRNELIELLQFDPATEQVYERPLLIFPPWINKFYILDLRAENSFIRWLSAQGYTVFVASWVNPDKKLAQATFEDYMRNGIFAALDAVHDATGVRDPNVVGYCIGGTLLSAALAYMAARGDNRVNSATFFAAQADFSEAGDLKFFVDDAQLEALRQQMENAGGVLEGKKMATTFNMLRSNDLIWSFVVSNYLLGKTPMPFDLLYWNSDTTRMPEATHLFYLREFYKNNAFSQGQMVLDNVRLDPSAVKIPVYLQSAKDDHIAPYRSVYKTTKLFGGPIRFIIAGSGHIAGVINPPSAKKYQYWTNDAVGGDGGKAYPPTVEEWQAGSKERPSSWWPDWDTWLSKLSGKKVPARNPGDGKLKAIEDAPGSYVKVKAQ